MTRTSRTVPAMPGGAVIVLAAALLLKRKPR